MESAETSPPPSSMPKAAKVGHKKSRLGCQRCKTRRVKCDEQKPVCGSCRRHQAECVYLEQRPQLSSHESSEGNPPRRRQSRVSLRHRSPSPTHELFPRSLSEQEGTEIPESKGRRLMELRLMQNACLHMVGRIITTSDEWLRLWQQALSTMCLEHENLMYAQFALSATNILRTHPDDEDLYSARQNYFVLALREQRKACAHIQSQNAEAVCLTSMVILHTSFAMIHERPLGNYNPPIEWLKMGRGAGAVMWKASAAVAPEMPASFKVFMESYQQVLSEQELRVTLNHPFDTVYAAISKQTASDVLTNAYRRTLAYINNMQSAIDSGDSVHVLGRRLQAFPMVVPTKFIDQVELRHPCAFLVLAYYFAVAAQVDKEFWWLRGPKGDRTAANELHVLDSVLAATCPALMQWPLTKAGI